MGKSELWCTALVVAGLLACKSKEQGTAERMKAATSSSAVSKHDALMMELGSVLVKPAAFATGQDDTGDKLVVFDLRIEGVALANLAVYKARTEAWRFGLEGMRCDRISELGFEVIEIVHGNGGPMSASWYNIKGGPLDGALAKVFPGEGAGLCNVMPGSPAYWAERDESPLKRD